MQDARVVRRGGRGGGGRVVVLGARVQAAARAVLAGGGAATLLRVRARDLRADLRASLLRQRVAHLAPAAKQPLARALPQRFPLRTRDDAEDRRLRRRALGVARLALLRVLRHHRGGARAKRGIAREELARRRGRGRNETVVERAPRLEGSLNAKNKVRHMCFAPLRRALTRIGRTPRRGARDGDRGTPPPPRASTPGSAGSLRPPLASSAPSWCAPSPRGTPRRSAPRCPPRGGRHGLPCAVSGSRAALASPSDAWEAPTAATLVTALALESAGFFAAYALLHPDDDARVPSVVGTLALAATDVACLVAPSSPPPPCSRSCPLARSSLRRHASHRRRDPRGGAPRRAARPGPPAARRRRRPQPEPRAPPPPAGLLLSLAPGVGQVLAFALATWTAAYALRGSSSTCISTRPSSRSRTRSASCGITERVRASLRRRRPRRARGRADAAAAAQSGGARGALEVERDEEEGAEERENEDGG